MQNSVICFSDSASTAGILPQLQAMQMAIIMMNSYNSHILRLGIGFVLVDTAFQWWNPKSRKMSNRTFVNLSQVLVFGSLLHNLACLSIYIYTACNFICLYIYKLAYM